MSDKTDATFLLALLILTVIGLAISSAAHSAGGLLQRAIYSDQNEHETHR
jgi:hypothetical protein